MSPPLSDDQAARVERHTYLVPRIARKVALDLGIHGNLDDLESVGNEALVRSAMRYDPSGPASFSTYAYYRIRGAMIDDVRKRTPGRRKYKRALVRLEATQALLVEAAEAQDAQARSGQRQTLEQRVELARELVRKAALAVCLSEPLSNVEEDIVPGEEPDPEQLLLDADTRSRVWELVDELDDDQRALVKALYVQGLQMKEIAEQLGTSVATISRRHARIVELLGKRARARNWKPRPKG
jgi:RNA polymerase sigma factor for flagellar operon FliA